MKKNLHPSSGQVFPTSASMRQIALALTSLFLLGTGVQASSQTAVSFGGNYVSTSTSFNGSRVTTVTNDTRYDIQGDSSLSTVLSPTAGYTGPTFYGAFGLRITPGTATNPPNFIGQILDSGSTDGMYVRLQGPNATTVAAHQFMVFKKSDFMNGLNATNVSLDGTSSFSLTADVGPSGNAARFGEGRFLVMNGSSLYVSQTTWNLSNSMPVTLNPTATTWALYTPTATDLNFNQAGSTFSSMSFNDVTGLGFYAERDVMASAGNYNLNVTSFSATVVPEPSVYALLGLGFLLVLILRRRRGIRLS